jgi:hypothetical protein
MKANLQPKFLLKLQKLNILKYHSNSKLEHNPILEGKNFELSMTSQRIVLAPKY